MKESQSPGLPFPNMVIGMMGSAGGEIDPEVRGRIRELGASVARRGYVLLTGAAPGLPHDAVVGAKKEGGLVVGISPARNLEEHVGQYEAPTRGYDLLIYTGSGLMGREIENIRSCDAVVFAGGRSGTLGEFAIAYDEGKVIGVLEQTGGITEQLRQISQMLKKETGAIVCYDADPVALLDQLERVYKERVLPRQLETMEGHDPDGRLET